MYPPPIQAKDLSYDLLPVQYTELTHQLWKLMVHRFLELIAEWIIYYSMNELGEKQLKPFYTEIYNLSAEGGGGIKSTSSSRVTSETI